ncbi:M24 family metallopeptidase [Bacteroidota bacterium]
MAKKAATKTQDEVVYPQIVDTRLEQIRFILEDLKVDALAVTYLPNIRYITNFSGSAGTLFITPEELHFVTDDRYEIQIQDELYNLPNLQTHIARDVWTYLAKKNFLKGVSTMAFEADRMPYSDAVNIRNQVRPLKFKPAPNVVEPFTMPKAPEELAYIEQSAEIALKVYKKMLRYIKPGVTEKEIAIEIAHQTRLLGSEGDAFPIIVVSGARGALIHGQPSDKQIKNNEIVLLDFGCKVHGFSSDITRTFAVGKATREQMKIYKILYRAKEEAIANVRPGMNGKTLDGYARNIINKEGYGEYFQHSLGHGLGLETHEKPTVTFRMDDQIVPENCVLAIEPGIYLPNKFGMRIEDNILVTRNGGRHITKAPKELLVI